MDGVLNSASYFQKHPGRNPGTDVAKAARGDDRWWISMVDPEAVQRLNKIIKATGAKVVISSSWRYHNSPERMQRILDANGFEGEVIGKTPFARDLPQGIRDLEGTRGQEITVWLTRNTHLHIADNFVILDDMGPRSFAHLAPYLVQTTWVAGLLDEHVEQAISTLKGDSDVSSTN